MKYYSRLIQSLRVCHGLRSCCHQVILLVTGPEHGIQGAAGGDDEYSAVAWQQVAICTAHVMQKVVRVLRNLSDRLSFVSRRIVQQASWACAALATPRMHDSS